MHLTQDANHDGDHDEPGLAMFAAAMRCVLRTHHDSPVDGPEALESWTNADGYVWRWSTPPGQWRVTVGGAMDPRPLLHGPGGIWRVDAQPGEHTVGLALLMLRTAGAIPPASAAAQPVAELAERWQQPGPPAPNRVAVRPLTAVVRGKQFPVPPPPEPLRAVLYRPSDRVPKVPAGYLAVPTTTNQPNEHGHWEVTMPDGWRRFYDPAARVVIPYEVPEGEQRAGEWAALLFEADQLPDGIYPASSESRGAA